VGPILIWMNFCWEIFGRGRSRYIAPGNARKRSQAATLFVVVAKEPQSVPNAKPEAPCAALPQSNVVDFLARVEKFDPFQASEIRLRHAREGVLDVVRRLEVLSG
jgi:hypothetical protein